MQEKDYLNYRYFYKRAYYIASVAAGIKQAGESRFALHYEYLNDSPLQPIVVVRPAGNEPHKANFKISVIPALPENTFPAQKLLPDRNCVRFAPDSKQGAIQSTTSTPYYNACIRGDSTFVPYLKFVHGASTVCQAYKDACILGHLWLRQRGFGEQCSKGGLGNNEWALLMALLLRGGGPSGRPVLSAGYSAYQLFKGTLQFLSTTDLIAVPLVVPAGKTARFGVHSCPILFDETRGFNILFKMSPWHYRLLRYEARTSVDMLGDSVFDQFEPTFVLKEDQVLMKYDLTVKIPVSALPHEDEPLSATPFGLHCDKIHATLNRGLGDRVEMISITQSSQGEWSVNQRMPAGDTEGVAIIGLIRNPSNAGRLVDQGPSAEDKDEAASFREFWGEKAELRRFKDGSIRESLVWLQKASQPPITEQMVAYLLERHVGIETSQLRFFGHAFGRMLDGGLKSEGLSQFHNFMTAFNTLEQHIRALSDFPLQVRQISTADPQLSYTSVKVPLAGTRHASIPPANIILQFEGSGRWPEGHTAIERTKIAFLLKLGQQLEGTIDGVSVRVGLENEDRDLHNQSFLDVVFPTGAAFRIRIHHDRVLPLIERQLKDKSLDQRSREEAGTALAAYKRTFLRSPAHTQTMQTLCTRYPMLSSCVRLVKQWFNSHLLSPHFRPELIELLTVRSFVQPYPWRPPSSTMTGFIRTLFFLSRWDWRNEPLIVDHNDEMRAADVSSIMTRFEAWRKIDPAMNHIVLFAASSIDAEGTTWTDGSPSKVVAARMTSLAKAAYQALKCKGLDIVLESLFSSPLTDYDFVLYLNPIFTGNSQVQSKPKQHFKNLELNISGDVALIGYNPISSFLIELQSLYGQAIVFFHNGDGGDVIAGLWNPHNGPRSWKVNLAYATAPKKVRGEKEPMVEVNKLGILNEIARLGGDLIMEVKVNR